MMNPDGELEFVIKERVENFEHMPTEKAKQIIRRVKRNKTKLKIARKSKQKNRRK